MIGSGRCHGPGCQQSAVVEYWCSERCNAAWDRQTAGVSAPELPYGPTIAGIEREIVRAYGVPPGLVEHSPPTIGAMIDLLDSLPDHGRPESVKLTRQQFDALRRDQPERTEPWQSPSPASHLMGIPIELVDTVEESTPYLEQRKRFQRSLRDLADLGVGHRFVMGAFAGAAFSQVASEEPQVAHSGERGWLARLLDRLFGRGDA